MCLIELRYHLIFASMLNIENIYAVFASAIRDYHVFNDIEQDYIQSSTLKEFEKIFHYKSWIDTVQWHTEDEVRNPNISGEEIRYFKNKIDKLNQERTNLVEQIDDMYLIHFSNVKVKSGARLNTESLAWSLDRLSILALKIYHMQIEVNRENLIEVNRISYNQKLELLQNQRSDLVIAIQQFIEELNEGSTVFKVYRQVKMYNDLDLNPVLRKTHGL